MFPSFTVAAAGIIAATAGQVSIARQPRPDVSQRSSEGAKAQWPRWRGAAFDGTATTGRAIFDRPFELKIRWKKKLGPGYSGIVVAGGSAVTMFSDGRNDVVISLSADTGREQWRAAIGPSWGGKREVHVYLPRGYDQEPSRRWPAIYVLYGNEMLKEGHLAAALDREMGTAIEPAIVVFVQSTNAYEFARTLRPAHIKMITERLVPWIDGQFRTRTEPKGRILTGADEAGLAAVEIALHSPDIFGSILAQSLFPLSNGDRELLELIDRTPITAQTFYVDWGRYDPRRASDKLDVPGFSAQVRERLSKRGYGIRGHEWNDGSIVALWSARVVAALTQILPASSPQQPDVRHDVTLAYNRALGVSCEH